MSTPLLSEIVEKIETYLTGLSTDRELEGWIVGQLQRFMDSGDPGAIALSDEVDALFVELGERIIDEGELRARLSLLLRGVRSLSFNLGEPVSRAQGDIATTIHTVSPGAELRLAHSFR